MRLLPIIETLVNFSDVRWRRHATDRDPWLHAPGDPLFFHHIPKTGGTSLIAAIGEIVPPELAMTERGNLSAEFVDRLVGRGLRRGQFIHGHPLVGAAARLRGRSNIVTLLREPCEQLISNYLYQREDWRSPHHELSLQLRFREFVLARPRFAIFQTASLHFGIAENAEDPDATTKDYIAMVPSVLAYLDEMALVGVLSEPAWFMRSLAKLMRWPRTPRFPHRRKARISAKQRQRLREQCADLMDQTTLSPLFAAEYAVYRHAQALAEKQHMSSPAYSERNFQFRYPREKDILG